MLSLLTGFAAGTLHVVTGPDHLAALAPLALRGRRAAIRTGASWGLGHGIGVGIIGAIGIGARHIVDIESLSAYSEFVVGFLLIAIGLWAIRRSRRVVVHSHRHDHDSDEVKSHAHPHIHLQGRECAAAHEHPRAHQRHMHAAFGVGVIHGAAGTGHLFGVIPSLALPPAQAAMYLSAYLVAAVATMAGFGALVGSIVQRSGNRTIRRLMVFTGAAAVLVGAVWLANGWHALA